MLSPISPSQVKLDETVNISQIADGKCLNHDCLVLLFTYLDKPSLINAAQVCIGWRKAAYTPRFWRGSIPHMSDNSMSVETARSFKERGITSLSIPGESQETDPDKITELLNNCAAYQQTECLIVDQLDTSTSITEHYPQRFETLKHLALLHTPNSVVTKENFEQAMRPLVNLVQLHIGWPQDVMVLGKVDKFNYAEVLFSCLPELADLEISQHDFCGMFDVKQLPESLVYHKLRRLVMTQPLEVDHEVLAAVCSRFPALKHFSVPGRHAEFEVPQDEQDEDDYEGKLWHFSCLESVNFGNFVYQYLLMAPSIIFTTLFSGAQNLTALDLSVHEPYFGEELLDADFLTIIRSLPQLTVLIYGHRVGLRTFRKALPLMGNIEVLADISSGEDDTEEEITEFLHNINQAIPKLISLLKVYNIAYDVDNGEVTSGVSECANIRFISSDTYRVRWSHEIVMKVSTTNESQETITEWVHVEKGSVQWREAVGQKYFRLPETFDFGLIDFT